MKLSSFAKINFGLEVLRKRKDGFHEIRTLFQAIDLKDILTVHLHPGDAVHLSGDNSRIPWDETNLIHKAASLMKKEWRFAYRRMCLMGRDWVEEAATQRLRSSL